MQLIPKRFLALTGDPDKSERFDLREEAIKFIEEAGKGIVYETKWRGKEKYLSKVWEKGIIENVEGRKDKPENGSPGSV